LLTGGAIETGWIVGWVGTRRGRLLERGDPQVDLGHLKAGHFDIEIKTAERQVAQLLGEQPLVPSRIFRQLVIGDPKRAGLRGRQMLEAQGWHLVHAELAASEQPAKSGDQIAVAIDQNRDIEAKDPDAFSNLLDLFLAMPPWICGVRFKLGSRTQDDL
jgi:hypothetical protein